MPVSAEGYFPATIAAALAGRRPRFAYLVEMMFDTPARFWNGNRAITTLDAKQWIGARQLGQIDGLEEALNGESKQFTVSISGAAISSQMMQMAAAEVRDAYMYRVIRIWLQFFDEDWQCLDNPYALQAGLITGLPLTRSQPAQDGSVARTITVEADNIFYARSQAPRGYYTDSDQQARYPGDLGMQFIPELQDSTVAIPW
jgi:hypothetical protein